MNKFDKLVKEIERIVSKSPFKPDLNHARSTRKWVLKLKPDADQALEIAALAHDVERGLEPNYFSKTKEKWKDYKDHKKRHVEKSAKIIVELLRKHDFDDQFIEKVRKLVLNHEVGGDIEVDILVDADCLSFFEDNLEEYCRKNGAEKTRKKIKFTCGRMSDGAKKFLTSFKYDDSKLDLMFREEID